MHQCLKKGKPGTDAQHQGLSPARQRNYVSPPGLSSFVLTGMKNDFPSIFLNKNFFYMISHSKLIAAKSLLVLICVSLFSFTSKFGGDSFEVWLNGKRILQQVVHVSKGVQTLHLANASASDRLDIYYSHCGQTGTNRFITVKDEKDRPLKVWKFTDATGKSAAMSF